MTDRQTDRHDRNYIHAASRVVNKNYKREPNIVTIRNWNQVL